MNGVTVCRLRMVCALLVFLTNSILIVLNKDMLPTNVINYCTFATDLYKTPVLI